MSPFSKRPVTASVAWFLILAVMLHLGFLMLPLPPAPEYHPGKTVSKNKEIEVEPWDEKKKDSNKPIVRSSRVAKQREEDKKKAARFAGEFDQRVEKETKSPLKGKFEQGVTPKGRPDGGGQDSDRLAESAPETPSPNGEIPSGKGAHKKPGKKGPKGLGDLGMKDLLAFGQSPNALPDDIANGNETVLNTDHVRYASFINRIADEIYDPWVKFARNAVDTIYGQGRKLDANTYITKLGVTMDQKGTISEIRVLESSGIAELDEAPKKAFWEVEPFPNPPVQMFKNEETIKFVYEFHFEWKTSSFNIVPWNI